MMSGLRSHMAKDKHRRCKYGGLHRSLTSLIPRDCEKSEFCLIHDEELQLTEQPSVRHDPRMLKSDGKDRLRRDAKVNLEINQRDFKR